MEGDGLRLGFSGETSGRARGEHGLEAEKAPSGADVGQKLPEAQGGWRAQTGSSVGGWGPQGAWRVQDRKCAKDDEEADSPLGRLAEWPRPPSEAHGKETP